MVEVVHEGESMPHGGSGGGGEREATAQGQDDQVHEQDTDAGQHLLGYVGGGISSVFNRC